MSCGYVHDRPLRALILHARLHQGVCVFSNFWLVLFADILAKIGELLSLLGVRVGGLLRSQDPRAGPIVSLSETHRALPSCICGSVMLRYNLCFCTLGEQSFLAGLQAELIGIRGILSSGFC